ncbi:MAG: hypothetical protein AB9866_13090 [Syntrophobacteraceae bacterium]
MGKIEHKSTAQYKISALAGFITLAGLLVFSTGPAFSAEVDPAQSVRQIEATVIHVDQYAVYVPNLIFYFDTQMEKRKISSLSRTAEQMRNKKVLITYSSPGGTTQDKHLLLVDLVPARETVSSERPPRPAPRPPGDAPAEPAYRVREETSTVPDAPVELRVPPRPPAPREAAVPPPQTASLSPGLSATITREEITSFIHRLMELNGRKDLGAVMPFYADRVDYYDRGVVERDYVKRDLGYYFRNWDRISTSLDGEVVVIVLDQPDVRVAKFVSSFSVQNDRKSLTGRTENIWRIRKINGQLKLFDVKQKMIR